MIRIAMIGYGNMSRAYLRQMPPLADRVKFTAMVDIDAQRARHAEGAAAITAGALTLAD